MFFESIIALIALSLMEIVLGIDNIVFISILTSKLPLAQQSSGRKVGLLLALGTRLALLVTVFWIAHLVAPIFSLSDFLPVQPMKSFFYVPDKHTPPAEHIGSAGTAADDSKVATTGQFEKGQPKIFDEEAWEEFNHVSWRDIILLAGGIFLIFKSVQEIHAEVEGEGHDRKDSKQPTYAGVIFQIAIMDIIFSLDSVITAVGMAEELWVMVVAMIVAVGVMILFADKVGDFVDRNPTVKMLALNFLLLIGVMLVAEGIGTPISKGYVYFAMAFSLMVEVFNTQIRKRATEPKSKALDAH